jgi:two-component system NtrC family response regulator
VAEKLPELERLVASRETDKDEDWLRAVAVLGRGLCERGEYHRALALGRSVSERTLEASSLRVVFSYLTMMVSALRRSGQLEEAEAVAADLLARTQRSRDLLLEGHASGQLANILRARGRLREAQQLYARAVNLHREGGDLEGEVRDHLNRASVLNRLGFPGKAREAFAEAHRKAREIGHEVLSLKAAIGMGMVAVREGRWDEARRLLLGTWREARRKGMPREEALSLEFLGELHALRGRLPQARVALRMCLALAERLAPGGDLMVEARLREAILALGSRSWERAQEAAERAISLAVGTGLAWEEAQGWRLLGVALARQGDRGKALEAFRRAVGLFEGMGERLEVRLARSWVEYLSGRGRGIGASASSQPWLWHPLWVPGAWAAGTKRGEARRAASRGAQRAGGDLDAVWERLGLVTRNPGLRRVLREAQEVARGGRPILILGETGTGKELLARGIHELSGRKGSFVAFNCAACPPDLVESELFGVERGAFTGAVSRRDGLIQRAAGGTLFLDEVGDLEDRAQGALLRFLDSGELRRLGSTEVRCVTVGVLSATHRPLEERVRRGDFRKDLFYRLCGVQLRLPPLRERLEDLDLLVRVLWRRLAPDRPVPEWLVSEATLDLLRRAEWPGNVRQLEHLVSRLALAEEVRDPERLVIGILGEQLRRGSNDARPTASEVMQALWRSGGERKRAAELLGVSRSRLYRLLREYGLEG